jgi:hypothetical protein
MTIGDGFGEGNGLGFGETTGEGFGEGSGLGFGETAGDGFGEGNGLGFGETAGDGFGEGFAEGSSEGSGEGCISGGSISGLAPSSRFAPNTDFFFVTPSCSTQAESEATSATQIDTGKALRKRFPLSLFAPISLISPMFHYRDFNGFLKCVVFYTEKLEADICDLGRKRPNYRGFFGEKMSELLTRSPASSTSW